MIDAQAVWAHLQEVANVSSGEQRTAVFEEQLQRLSLKYERDADGNYFLTLPGKNERTVVIGSYLARDTRDTQPGAGLDLVTGLETMKALAHRFNGVPPCTLLLVVWAKRKDGQAGFTESAVSALLSRSVTAYLSLHVELLEQLKHAGLSLGVVAAVSPGEGTTLNPRLMALCDEAIRELTGTSMSLPSASDDIATALARNNVPTALMCVELLTKSTTEEVSQAERLHMLQAAEAFGRWTESALHMVAGEDVDLWAREKRMPHSHPEAS